MPHLIDLGVPGFCNDLGVGQDRILLYSINEGRSWQKLTLVIPAKDSRQIKAKSIDVHLQDPVTQAVHDQRLNHWMVAVYRVATA